MDTLTIVKCRETGICSIIKENGIKVDLMPDEALRIQESGQSDQVKAVIAEADASFSASLDSSELNHIASKVK